MFFNSLDFAIYLPVVFLIYWFVANKSISIQNVFIVAASYFFYGWWDWRFLSLIAFSTLVDFIVGRKLGFVTSLGYRRVLLLISVVVNLGFLGFFKYYDFFLENFVSAFSFMGFEIKANTLNIILPVGISFYTFQTLSYTIDIYRKKLTPTNNIITFAAFVSFFPQLVAGPIERATNLLPQFYKSRVFNYHQAKDGVRQILWGLFKKIVIADNAAEIANQVFQNHTDYSGSTLLLGAICFAFQIYGDFSGYSDIAIGTSKLFGFGLMRNFAYPYFSRDIAEFWRRWHISLSTWFRDYVYIPLGGSKGTSYKKIRNVFIIFIVSGFWHGANWTFIIWGALNALYFLPLLLLKRNRKFVDEDSNGSLMPSIKEVFQISTTFLLTVFAWIFFRAENVSHALEYLNGVFSKSIFSIPELLSKQTIATGALIVVMLTMEWVSKEKLHPLENLEKSISKPLRWILYLLMILIMYFLGNNSGGIAFIYFQF